MPSSFVTKAMAKSQFWQLGAHMLQQNNKMIDSNNFVRTGSFLDMSTVTLADTATVGLLQSFNHASLHKGKAPLSSQITAWIRRGHLVTTLETSNEQQTGMSDQFDDMHAPLPDRL
jgi:hypothetical protein